MSKKVLYPSELDSSVLEEVGYQNSDDHYLKLIIFSLLFSTFIFLQFFIRFQLGDEIRSLNNFNNIILTAIVLVVVIGFAIILFIILSRKYPQEKLMLKGDKYRFDIPHKPETYYYVDISETTYENGKVNVPGYGEFTLKVSEDHRLFRFFYNTEGKNG